jgi:uncharacterized protein YjlB
MQISETSEVNAYRLEDDGTFPNNAEHPLLVYAGAFTIHKADAIADVFRSNQWENIWYNGIYSFHHYHSTAHEVLGIASGQGRVQFGGEKGIILDVHAGVVVVVPAGVAHKKLSAEPGFLVVGGYPSGQYPDMMYGKPGERPLAEKNILRVANPASDPLYGEKGPLIIQWKIAQRRKI